MILLKTMEQQGLSRGSHTQEHRMCSNSTSPMSAESAARGRAQVAPVEDRIFAAFSKQEAGGLFALSFPALSVRSMRDKLISLGAVEDATSRTSLACGGGEP